MFYFILLIARQYKLKTHQPSTSLLRCTITAFQRVKYAPDNLIEMLLVKGVITLRLDAMNKH